MKKNDRFYSINSFFKSIVIYLFATGLMGSALAQGPWTAKKDLNIARYQHGTCAVNGKIYVIGGETHGNGVGSPATKSVEEYDPATDSWTPKKDMPTARESLWCSVLDGKIYAIGGSRVIKDSILTIVEVYDPLTDTWDTTKAAMDAPRRGLSTCVVNGKIYALGGLNTDTDTFLKIVEEYDPATDTWTTKAPMLYPRSWFITIEVDGKIIAMGGQTGDQTIEEYDPATDEWSLREGLMPLLLAGSAASYINGLIYIFGGTNVDTWESYNNAWSYNPLSGIWRPLTEMTTIRSQMSAAEINGLIYLTGGNANPQETWYPFTPIATVEMYNPRNDFLPLVENLDVDKSFAMPGVDSVLITSKINNPTDITLFAEIETPDQTPVDSLQLFDDGNHKDGSAGDSLFANSWPTWAGEEHKYSINLQVTRIDSDTVVNHLDSDAVFTTIGPVKTSEPAYIDTSYDDVSKTQSIFLILQNYGITAAAVKLSILLDTDDPRIENMVFGRRRFPSLLAGEIDTTSIYNFFSFKYADGFLPDCTLTNPIQFDLAVSSDNYPYWISTFDFVAGKLSPTTIADNPDLLPTEFILHQNFPNPFNPTTNIEYTVRAQHAVPQQVNLSIYNLLGQKVATLVNKKQPTGTYNVQWDASGFASGIYIYQLTAKGQKQTAVFTKKLVLLK